MTHVMNYKELVEAFQDGSVVYEESRVLGLIRPLKSDGIDFRGVKHNCFLLLDECNEENCPDYNLFYRCWNEEPSEELMNSTPWKENPYGEPT